MSVSEKLVTIAENVPKVYEAGKKAEWSAFWDDFQAHGNRVDYSNAFAQARLTDKTFRPKYDIRPTTAYYMFLGNVGITDLKNLDIELDFSQCTRFQGAFQSMSDHAEGIGVLRIGVIDTRAGTYGSNELDTTFGYNPFLKEIEKIILKDDGSQGFPNAFTWCAALKEIHFEGVIGCDIAFDYCPLSKASITSIINALSSITSGKTLTLKQSAKEAAFTDEEWAELIATKPNWAFAFV